MITSTFVRKCGIIGAVLASAVLMNVVAQTDSASVLKDTGNAAATTMKKKSTSATHKIKQQTTCPVTGDPIDKNLYVDYKEKRIYVCCADCIDKAKKNPEKYIKKLESMGQGVETIGDKTKKQSKDVKADTSMKGMDMKGMEMIGDTMAKDANAGYWTCPMHPEIHQSTAGKCPMCGMNLVFKKSEKDIPKMKSKVKK